jgi:hypothetical protein
MQTQPEHRERIMKDFGIGKMPAKEIHTFTAFRENGDEIYSGVINSVDNLEKKLAFYADGHPIVHRIVVSKFVFTEEREIPVNRDPERLKTWNERNER